MKKLYLWKIRQILKNSENKCVLQISIDKKPKKREKIHFISEHDFSYE